MGIELEGMGDIKDKLSDLKDNVDNMAAEAAFQHAFKILSRSKEVVPKGTGRLARSGDISKAYKDSDGPAVVVFYDTSYAEMVHETHGTNANYLKGPLDRLTRSYASRLEQTFQDWAEKPSAKPRRISSKAPSGEGKGRETL